jgi:hypothetical protein
MGIQDPVVALNFDMAATVRMRQEIDNEDPEHTKKVHL